MLYIVFADLEGFDWLHAKGFWLDSGKSSLQPHFPQNLHMNVIMKLSGPYITLRDFFQLRRKFFLSNIRCVLSSRRKKTSYHIYDTKKGVQTRVG